MSMKRKILTSVLVLFFLYILSYGYFRQTHLEKEESDNKTYLAIGKYEWVFYHLYRPLIIVDYLMTDIGLKQRG